MITMLAPMDFLELIMCEAEILLPFAGYDPLTTGQADTRLLDEDHECLRCGDGARNALVCMVQGRPDLGFRWLDLCHGCRCEIAEAMDARAVNFKPPERP